MPESKHRPYELSIALLLKNMGLLYYYLGRFLLILLVVIILGAYIISVFDQKDFADSLYLSLITATTIGYGDFAPISYISKIVAVVLGITGTTFTGIVVAINVEAVRRTLRDQLSPEELEKLKKSR